MFTTFQFCFESQKLTGVVEFQTVRALIQLRISVSIKQSLWCNEIMHHCMNAEGCTKVKSCDDNIVTDIWNPDGHKSDPAL